MSENKRRRSFKELKDTEKIYWVKMITGALTGTLMGVFGLENLYGWLTIFVVLLGSSYIFGKVFANEEMTYKTMVKTAMFSYLIQSIFWWILLFNFYYNTECIPCNV